MTRNLMAKFPEKGGVSWAGEAFYLSVDPGETVGWATFDEQGNGLKNGTVIGRPALLNLLRAVNPTVIICEDFMLYPWKSKDQAFSQFETVKVIGWLEMWAHIKKIVVHLQPSNVLTIALMWSGIKAPKGHLPDEMSAYAHGVYWLQKNNIRKPQQSRMN